jgi:hypothetical protein
LASISRRFAATRIGRCVGGVVFHERRRPVILDDALLGTPPQRIENL